MYLEAYKRWMETDLEDAALKAELQAEIDADVKVVSDALATARTEISAEIDADVILLAKKVDAVYDSDPNVNKNAVKFDSLSYIDVLNRGLGVMDSTATSLCMDNNIPIRVFGLDDPENIKRAISGEEIGTIVK